MTAFVLHKSMKTNSAMCQIGSQIVDVCPLCLFVILPWSLTVQHIGAQTPAERVESHYFQLHR